VRDIVDPRDITVLKAQHWPKPAIQLYSLNNFQVKSISNGSTKSISLQTENIVLTLSQAGTSNDIFAIALVLQPGKKP
jgi:hypothetical protein